MENYYKLVPLLKNKFSKTELKEVPGWRRKQDMQTPLEMKIESQIPAYINNRSDFNKNPVYPQWTLRSGTTYSPKGNAGSRKTFHNRVKSDQELLNQCSSRLTPIKENKAVYLKKLETIEEHNFDKFKRRIEDYKEGIRVKRELKEGYCEKVNIPAVMFEFLVKENKDFEFRQGLEEEFFSKDGFRVNQGAAHSERVILKDQDIKVSQTSLKTGLKGDLQMKEVEGVKELEEEKEKEKEVNNKDYNQVEKKKIQRALKEKKVASNIEQLSKDLKITKKKRESKTKSVEFSNGEEKIKNQSVDLSTGELKIKNHKLNEDINALNIKEFKKQEHTIRDETKRVNKQKEKKKNLKKEVQDKSGKIIDQVRENSKQSGKKSVKLISINFKNPKKSLKGLKNSEKNIIEGNPTKHMLQYTVCEVNHSEEEAISQQGSPILSHSQSSVSDKDHSNPDDTISGLSSESLENSIEEPISPQAYNHLRRVKTFSSIKPNKKKKINQIKTIKFKEDILEQSEEIMPEELIEYYNRNKEDFFENEEELNIPVLKTDKKQFKRNERRTKSLAVGFKRKKNSKSNLVIGSINKDLNDADDESSFSPPEAQNFDQDHAKRKTIKLKKAKTALILPLETKISEIAPIETPEEEEGFSNVSQDYYETKVLLKTDSHNSSAPKAKVNIVKLKNPDFSRNTSSKKQDSNIFARKNRKSQIIVSNVPQVKEEPIENSNLLKITKTNRTSSNNLGPQYISKFSKSQQHSEAKSSEISSLKNTLRNFSEKQSQQEISRPEKLKDKFLSQQRPKKQDFSKPEDSQQLSIKSPMPPKQRNSIKFDLKDPLMLKKSPRPQNFQDKPRRKAKKRETYQSLQDSSDNFENSQESESSSGPKRNRNLNTLQYELNLMERMKKSSPLKRTEELNSDNKDKFIEDNESGSSYDAEIDVDKEIGDLIKTKHFSMNNLVFSGPVSFKFAQKMEVISGVNVNELEVNENTKDHGNQDYVIEKQRFLNWKKHQKLEFDYGFYSLQIKDVQELLPGEGNRKYIRKTKQKMRNEQFFNSKIAFKHRDPITFSGLAQGKKAFIKKKTSFDENTRAQYNSIHPNMSERVYSRIKNNQSLPNLNHHRSESAQDLLNSIKLNMQALEKVYEP